MKIYKNILFLLIIISQNIYAQNSSLNYDIINSYKLKIKEDYNELFQFYHKTLQKNKKKDLLYFLLGYDHLTYLKNYDSSIIYLKAAISLNPKNEYYWFYIIEAISQKNNQKNLVKYLKRASKKFPNNSYFKERLLYHYYEQNNTKKAIKISEEILKSDPDKLEIKNLVSSLYFQLLFTKKFLLSKKLEKKALKISYELLSYEINPQTILNITSWAIFSKNKNIIENLKKFTYKLDSNHYLNSWLNFINNIYFENSFTSAINYFNKTIASNSYNLQTLSYFLNITENVFNFKKLPIGLKEYIYQSYFNKIHQLQNKNSQDVFITENFLSIFESFRNSYLNFLQKNYSNQKELNLKYLKSSYLIYPKSHYNFWHYKSLYYNYLYNYTGNEYILDTIILILDTAISYFPFSTDFYFNKSHALLIKNKIYDSEMVIKNLLETNPFTIESFSKNVKYIFFLAELYYYMKKYDISLYYLCEAHNITKKINDYYKLLYAYLLIKNDCVSDTLEKFINEYYINKSNDTSLNCIIIASLALLNTKKKNYNLAFEYYQELLKLYNKYCPILVYEDIGDYFYELKDFNQAIEFWSLSLENDVEVTQIEKKILKAQQKINILPKNE